MFGVNKAIIVGHLGRDPETRFAQSGGKIVNMSVATSESWKDKTTGERKEKTEWHKVVIFNERLAEVAERYLRKGSKVYLEGSLQTRKWQGQDGQDRYATEIVLQQYRGELTLLDSCSDNNDAAPGDRGEPRGQGAPQQSAASDLDDEIPF